jgi:hypothetical protein
VLLEPRVELAHWDDDAPTLPHHPNPRQDVLIEVVAAYSERLGGLIRS